MLVRKARVLTAVALAATMAGCDVLPLPTPDPRRALAAELAARQAAWEARGIRDYVFEVLYGCFCPPEMTGPFEIVVTDGVVTSVTREGRPVPPAQLLRAIPTTIEAVFGVVAANLSAPRIVVTFDPEWDVPRTIEVDPIENAIDDEFGVQVTGFRPAG